MKNWCLVSMLTTKLRLFMFFLSLSIGKPDVCVNAIFNALQIFQFSKPLPDKLHSITDVDQTF